MKKQYSDLLRRLRSNNEYWKRFSLLLFTTDIRRLMKNEPKPLSAAKLAARIDVKPPVISSWLRGGENLTIETMNKIAAGLDAVVYIHVAKKGTLVRWVEEKPGDSPIPMDKRAFEQIDTVARSQIAAENEETVGNGRPTRGASVTASIGPGATIGSGAGWATDFVCQPH
jgi:transcriptional regulator with XRE-family HTH domain